MTTTALLRSMKQRFAILLTLLCGVLLISTPAFANHGSPHSTLELRDPVTGANTIDYTTNGTGSFSVAVQFQNNTAAVALQFDVEFTAKRPSNLGIELLPENIIQGTTLVSSTANFRGQNFIKHILDNGDVRKIHRVVITPSEDNQLLASGTLAILNFTVPAGLSRNETIQLANVVESNANESAEPVVATSGIVINSGVPEVVLAPESALPREITQNTTLQGGGTYHLTTDIWVRPGATLTVDPGVKIRATVDNCWGSAGGGTTGDGIVCGNLGDVGTGSGTPIKTQIIVEGAIVVNGTVDAPVVIESWLQTCTAGKGCVRSTPYKGQWDGIVITGNSVDSYFSHAVIQWAKWGLRFENGSARVLDSVVQSSLTGIEIAGNSTPDIERTVITNDNAGVRIIRDTTYSGVPAPQITNDDIFGNISETVVDGWTGDVTTGDGKTYNLVTTQNAAFQGSTPDINAIGNWWGVADNGAIGQTIVDISDNGVLPRVSYVPFLAQSVNTLRFPVASAGPDLTVNAGQVISLDGRNSTDDVGIVAYEWSGYNFGIGIQNSTTPVATIQIPASDAIKGKTLNYKLVVKNGLGLLSTDYVSVFVRSGSMPVGLVAEGNLSGGAIAANATFNGYYAIDGSVSVAAGTTTTVRAGSYLKFSANSTVAVDGTLIVEPGARLSFAKGANLLVNGVLQALGTAATPVQFTSDEANPARGSWQGIVIGPASSGSIIQYADIQYATVAVDVQGATVEIRNSTVGNFSEMGISLSASAGGVIADNVIDNQTNTGIGIYLEDTSVPVGGAVNSLSITGNQILNTSQGVSINGLSNPVINGGNEIANNTLGIVINGGGAGVTVSPVIEGNDIYGNSVYNVALNGFGDGGNAVVDVSNNYWGTTSDAEIQDGILDNADYVSAPSVNYDAVLATPVQSVISVVQPSDQITLKGASVGVQINASNSSGGSLVYSASGLPPGLSINASTGRISGTITGAATTYSPVVLISDGTNTVTVSFTWVVLMPANAPPTANAGADQSVTSGANVQLSAAASSDSDGSIVSYQWLQISGSLGVTMTSPTSSSTTFVAPSVVAATTLIFQVTVTDNNGDTAQDTVTITVSPIATSGGFTVTVLPVSGPGQSAKALAINDNGDVVGSQGADAVVWKNGAISVVGTADAAYDINSSGDIVGVEDGWAVLYRNGARTYVATQSFSRCTGVNSNGDIVGYLPYEAFLYRGGVLNNLGTFGWGFSGARAINDVGQVVGTLFSSDGRSSSAFIWQDGVKQEIAPVAGSYSYATGINNQGRVVGLTSTSSIGSDRHVFTWQNGVMTDLGIAVGDVYANGHYAINDLGTIVGPTFVYRGGVVTNATDLMKLLPASATGAVWLALTLEDVNNLGQIAGHASRFNFMTYVAEEVPVVFSPAP